MSFMGLRKYLILRSPQRGRLEGRTSLIQANANSFTGSQESSSGGSSGCFSERGRKPKVRGSSKRKFCRA